MKKIISTFAAIAAFAALLPSCTKENFSQTPETGVIVPEGRQLVVFGTSLTKTSNDEGRMSWAEGDSVKILWAEVVGKCVTDPEKDSIAVLDTTARVDAATGSISAVVGTARDYYYAVYPHWATSSLLLTEDEQDSLTVTVKSTSTTGAWDRAHYAAALTDADSKNFNFKNISNALKFTVTTEGVTEVRISPNDGSATVGKLRFAFNGEEISNDFRNVTPQVKSTITVNGPGTYYAPVMMDAQWIEGFTIEEYVGTEFAGLCTTTNGICWSRNEVYYIGALEDHKTTPHDWYFTPDGKGDEDGTSWDNAASKAKFIELLTCGIPGFINERNLYFAAGDYDLENGDAVSIDPVLPSYTSFNIYGGYPADATGTDLSGRDVANNITKMYTSSNKGIDKQYDRMLFFTKTTYLDKITFDGIQFGPYESKITKAIRGYALYVNAGCKFKDESGVITFNNCTFKGNTGLIHGMVDLNNENGTLNITNCTFDGNTNTSTSSCCGALWFENGTFNVTDCTFKNNVAGGAMGAAVGIGSGDTKSLEANFTGCTFDSNTAAYGGAVNHGWGNATFRNCTFSKNSATKDNANVGGGAVMTAANTSVPSNYPNLCSGNTTFKNCTFTENTSYGRGGAIHHLSSGKFLIDSCTFNSNYTSVKGNGGGAIFHGGTSASSMGALCIANTHFDGNKCLYDNTSGTNKGKNANGSGAAIATKSGKVIYLYNCSFANHVTTAGAKTNGSSVLCSFKIDASTGGEFYLFGCSFLDNDTQDSRIYMENAVPALIANCSFAETIKACKKGVIASSSSSLLTAVNNLVITTTADGASFGNGGTIVSGSNVYGGLTGVTLAKDASFADDAAGNAASNVFEGTPAFNAEYKIPTVAGLETIMAPVAAETVKNTIQTKNSAFYTWLEEMGAFTKWSGANWRCGAYQD